MAAQLEKLGLDGVLELREEVKQVGRKLRAWGIKDPAFEEFKRSVGRRVQGLRLKDARRGQQLQKELQKLQTRVKHIQEELGQTPQPKPRRARRKK